MPPLAQWQSMPSAAATAPTSSTVAKSARHRSTAARREETRATLSIEAGKSEEHQPPLRPEAPKPATSRSSTATRIVGSALTREYAVHSPV